MENRFAIAILGGTGNEGGGLALRFAKAGHRVIVGSREREKAERAAADFNEQLGVSVISGLSSREAARAAEIIVLTVPYAAQRAIADEVRDALDGKILIDATAPLLPPKVGRVQLPSGGSAVAELQERLSGTVKVVSAFQNVSAHHLRDLSHEVECDVIVCGDDPAACETVIGLIRDIGLHGFYAGPICNSAAAEALTSILISINRRYKVRGAGIRITGVPGVGA
jgi:8-hydroxy-5-deazaflavin:NADPH oxidoreductase